MFAYRLIFLAFLNLFVQNLLAEERSFLPPEQAFKVSAAANVADSVELSFEIAQGYHLYRDKFKFQSQTEDVELGQAQLPEGVIDHDQVFGDVVVYRGGLLKIPVPIINKTAQNPVKLLVKYQGCADDGVCYPPQKAVFEVNLPAAQADNSFKQLLQGVKGLGAGLLGDELLKPEQAFQFFASVKDANTVHVSWIAADGYYLYKQKLNLTLDSKNQTQLAAYHLPKGEPHNDPEFGQVEIYRQEIGIDVPLQRTNLQAETVVITAKFQGCADRGVCYPPMQTSINLDLPVATAQTSKPLAPQAISEQDQIVNSLKQDSLALTLLSFFGFGVLLSLTPCIFPMIPILSGIIVGQGHNISTRKSFLLSLSYVLASALMYTAFGVLAALFGSNLQATFQEPWVIATFSGVFVLLSLSMFGFYNLELPKSLQTRVHHSSDAHRDGSYLGAGVMGALSSLIVGPCVAAPLAAALIYIGQTGDVVLGGSALFVMALGMGMPLLLLGASAGKLLPKAGAWLNTTKAVFGVIMLVVALWMLSRILPATVTMLLSAMLLIIPSIYLGAIEPLPNPASGWKKLWKGLGLILLILGVLQLIGLSAGNSNVLQPLQGLASAKAETKTHLVFQRVKTVAELERLLQEAAAKQQPVMLDFYAEWCVSCKELEAYTFTDAKVQQQLSGYLLLQADVTENNEDDKALLKRFNLVGPPGIMFYGTDGQEKTANRVIGYQDPAKFLSTLQQL